jgi:hypothetical protein
VQLGSCSPIALFPFNRKENKLTTVEEAVQRGLEWLQSEQARSLGYDINNIDPDTLISQSVVYCPLAQASGTKFWDAPRPWDNADHRQWEIDHGFSLDELALDIDYNDWNILTQAWKQALANR